MTPPTRRHLALATGAPVAPLVMFGTRPKDGGKDALPAPQAVVDLVYGAPFRAQGTPWPGIRTLVAASSEALHTRMLEEVPAGLALTGQTMPGPIPADEAREIS